MKGVYKVFKRDHTFPTHHAVVRSVHSFEDFVFSVQCVSAGSEHGTIVNAIH